MSTSEQFKLNKVNMCNEELLNNLKKEIIPDVIKYFKNKYAFDKNESGYYILLAGTETSGCVFNYHAEEVLKNVRTSNTTNNNVYYSDGDNLYLAIVFHSSNILKYNTFFNPDMLDKSINVLGMEENDYVMTKPMYDFGKILKNTEKIYMYEFIDCGNNPPPNCVNLSKDMQKHSALQIDSNEKDEHVSKKSKKFNKLNKNEPEDTNFCVTHFRFISDAELIKNTDFGIKKKGNKGKERFVLCL